MRGSRNFGRRGGGGGVQALLPENRSDSVFFCFVFFRSSTYFTYPKIDPIIPYPFKYLQKYPSVFNLEHARIQELWPGGGVQALLPENRSDSVFFVLFFSVLNLFYSFTVVYQLFISKKTIVFQGFRGGPTFSRGGGGVYHFPGEVQLFPGGV